jgi:hypothetical protein
VSQKFSFLSNTISRFLAVARATFAEEMFPTKEDIRVFRIPGEGFS